MAASEFNPDWNVIREFLEVNGIREEQDSKRFRFLYHEAARAVRMNVKHHGEDGYGNKPEEMNTTEYWLSNLPDNFIDWKG